MVEKHEFFSAVDWDTWERGFGWMEWPQLDAYIASRSDFAQNIHPSKAKRVIKLEDQKVLHALIELGDRNALSFLTQQLVVLAGRVYESNILYTARCRSSCPLHVFLGGVSSNSQ